MSKIVVLIALLLILPAATAEARVGMLETELVAASVGFVRTDGSHLAWRDAGAGVIRVIDARRKLVTFAEDCEPVGVRSGLVLTSCGTGRFDLLDLGGQRIIEGVARAADGPSPSGRHVDSYSTPGWFWLRGWYSCGDHLMYACEAYRNWYTGEVRFQDVDDRNEYDLDSATLRALPRLKSSIRRPCTPGGARRWIDGVGSSRPLRLRRCGQRTVELSHDGSATSNARVAAGYAVWLTQPRYRGQTFLDAYALRTGRRFRWALPWEGPLVSEFNRVAIVDRDVYVGPPSLRSGPLLRARLP